MLFGKYKYLIGAVFGILLAFKITSCVPEQGIEAHTKQIPMYGVNESELVVQKGSQFFRYAGSKLHEKISTAPPPLLEVWDSQIPLLLKNHKAFFYEYGHRYVNINGDKIEVTDLCR